jgi:hypothetical protein
MRAQLPDVAGALSVALAHGVETAEPNMKNPAPEHWGCDSDCSMN